MAERNGAPKPVIFISYSHKDEPKTPGPKDERWLSFVQSHLQPAVKHGMYDLWVDEDIPGGGAWRDEITSKLNDCDVCVLLVSRHSLASDFIIDVEIDTLRKRREKGEVEIFPIVLTHCAVKTAPWIREINLRPPNGQPLSDFEENERDKQMAAIAEEIAAIAIGIAEKRRHARQGQQQLEWLLKQPFGQGRALHRLKGLRRIVDVGRLPETAYERLVGREAELKRLDDAWSDAKINILSLVAEGGAGKSALVNEWLKRLQAESYRGADAALAWSFHSQGTQERATSAEEFLDWAVGKLGIVIETPSANAKGEAIAEELMQRRVLLLLDGIEPLQHGLDTQFGELKDQGLRALLRRVAATPPTKAHGLVVLTSRIAVKDIARWRDGAAPVIELERLSEEAGAALLRDNGVWGTDAQLRAAARDFGGHPLALGLLASFLEETQTGDVRRRDHIRGLPGDADNPRHEQARRVMESYEREWLADQPALRAIMHMIGLFDRPASGDCMDALRRPPPIEGLTDAIADLDEDDWRRAVARLRAVRLLAPVDSTAPGTLDAHPLVRDWFGQRLEATNEAAWKTAHRRLYKHLRDTTREGSAPTLADLAPLYQAIAHGCRAGRHQQALNEVYKDRICRRYADGTTAFYSRKKLGALGSNLAVIAWFFDKPYETPVAALKERDRSWVLSEAAFSLRGQGRFAEALPSERASLRMFEDALSRGNAAIAASNLSQAELLAGEVAAAVATAERSVAHADRNGDAFQMMVNRATYADALHAAGRRADAEALFVDAERRQAKRQPDFPLLYSMIGYYYCDLLLAKGDHAAARERSRETLEWVQPQNWLLDIALDKLILGRACLGLALSSVRARSSATDTRDDARTACAQVDEAVDGLRSAGQNDFVPRGLLARAAFRRSAGDWDGAARDLDEVEEIAEPGPLRLFLCDMALERARLAFAKREAFAPLSEVVEDSSAKLKRSPPADRTRLQEEAARQIGIAADYIEACGYHRRDEELADLQAVLTGERAFASLPPHV
jgi:hypothetical protein